jgi:hypothetical protein
MERIIAVQGRKKQEYEFCATKLVKTILLLISWKFISVQSTHSIQEMWP